MIDKEVLETAARLIEMLRALKFTIVTAESCTGGLIAAALTEIPGSSDVVDRGFVTYSNAAKRQVLGVGAETLRTQGAVSEAVARAMAGGALAASDAQIAVGITGVAGPGGGSDEKPVGMVCFAWSLRRGRETRTLTATRRFAGDRAQVRAHAIIAALEGLLRMLDEKADV